MQLFHLDKYAYQGKFSCAAKISSFAFRTTTTTFCPITCIRTFLCNELGVSVGVPFKYVLLAVFAVAGVVVVTFLYLGNAGLIQSTASGLLLYANLVQISNNALLPLNEANILTVFIASLVSNPCC